MANPVKVLVIGCGQMGSSHTRAYHTNRDFEIVGLVSPLEDADRLSEELGGYPVFRDFSKALAETGPDAVSINTLPDSHAAYALEAIKAGCHVFVEKPLAETVADAEAVVKAAAAGKRKLLVGYILRHHPSWTKFIDIAHTLGKPLAMRMNLNQQNRGPEWQTHRLKLEHVSPIVDCGVHYVDIMCQMTQAKPVDVHAIGVRLADDIPATMYNYGQLQVRFDDGSVGWYEAGWGTMMSETAYFVKDIIGPKGSVSIVGKEHTGASGDVDSHTQTGRLRVHHGALNAEGGFAQPDEIIDMNDEPDHQGLCDLEQAYFLKAIREDIDLAVHMQDAINSLRIVLAADESVRTGKVVKL